MKLVMLLLFGVTCLLSGCGVPSGRVPTPVSAPTGAVESPVLWEPCDAVQAEQLRMAAQQDAGAALRGAACYAYLVERAGGDPAGARTGRQLAESAVAAFPANATAHYLLGYLAGLEAQHNPLRALTLVPVIEQEALAALALNPALDQGGPPRMLGDLYLRAPAFPASVGDTALAVEYFRQAVELAPDFADNRLGLIDALLAETETAEACLQLQALWSTLAPKDGAGSAWQRGLELQQRMCEGITGD